jgi:hypothetical protein
MISRMRDAWRRAAGDRHPGQPLFWVLVLAAGLRLYGISWGAPDATHSWSYHPDEPKLFLGFMDLPTFGLSNAANGCTYFFLYGAHTALGALFGLYPASLSRSAWTTDPSNLHMLYVWNRLLSVVIGLIAVSVFHAWTRRISNRTTALIAAFLLAILPHVVLTDHFLRPHSLILLLSLLYMHGLTRLAENESCERFLGFCAMAATATELPLGIMVAFGSAYVVFARKSIGRWMSGLALGAPLFVNHAFRLSAFANDMGEYRSQWIQWFSYPLSRLPHLLIPAVSATVLAVGFAGLIVLARDRKSLRPVLGYAALYAFVYFAFGHAFARRYLSLFPLFCLGTAYLVGRLPRARWITVLMVIATAAEPAVRTVAVLNAFQHADTRTIAAERIGNLVAAGARIANQNWFFAPHLSMRRFRILAIPTGELPDDTTAYVLTTDHNEPTPALLRAHGYEEILRVERPHRVGPIVFGDETWPEDMRYVNPVIYLYKRR